MKPSSCLSRLILCAVLAAAAGLAPGCANIFVAKHKVLVDAISAPGVAKPSGQSYRLLAKKAAVNNMAMEVSVVKACIDAALSSIGMFDAPPSVPPDVFIEVSYGTESGPRADPAARETFLQLSARQNIEGALDRTKGPEIWDVRVAVLGIAGRPETAMPLLASVAAKHIATDTKAETKMDVPQNEPSIASVRETAIKKLENVPTPAAPAAPTGNQQSPAAPQKAPAPATAAPSAAPPPARFSTSQAAS